MHARRIAQSLRQSVLHEREGEIVHRLGSHGVGQHPVGPGGNLGDQIGIPRGGERGGGRGGDRRVENHAQRRRAVERLLVAVPGDRRPVGGVSVHRRGRTDHQITAPVVVRGEFRKVVDHPRPHGHRHGVSSGEQRVEPFDVAPFGVEPGIGEDTGRVLPDSGLAENPVHLLPGHAPRIEVGDHQRPAPGKQFDKKFRRTGQRSDPERQRAGVGRAPERTFDLIHNIGIR